jgi:hypothetical protein
LNIGQVRLVRIIPPGFHPGNKPPSKSGFAAIIAMHSLCIGMLNKSAW